MACKHHWSCPLIHWRNPQTSFMQPNQILILCGCSLVFPVNCTADVLQVHCTLYTRKDISSEDWWDKWSRSVKT